MEARDRRLPHWFDRIQHHQIELPRFQRHEAWSSREVSDLIETVLRGLPAGAALILEVGDELPFISRNLVTAPESGERTTELLLDGQQRLTALWRALHDNYEDRTYFISTDEDNLSDPEGELVVPQARWLKDGKRYPVWADSPEEVLKRGFVPLSLLRPGDIADEVDAWLDKAAGDDITLRKQADRLVNRLRTRVREFNLPFLALPATTPKGVALDVFIKMNTSAVTLTTFDIIVAQMEGATGKSLHDLLAALHTEAPALAAFGKGERIVLDALALHQDRPPNQTGYWALDFGQVVRNWHQAVSAIQGAIGFLEEEKVFDDERLPTGAVVRVLAGIWPYLPERGDALGNARTILRKYTWRAFLTSRYDRAAATAAFNDFRGLRRMLVNDAGEDAVPLFDDELFPKPTTQQLMAAGWPKNRGILGRGILGLSLRCGALDIADNTPVSRKHVQEREYHHLFPVAYLEKAGIGEARAFRALNCSLITWSTNRTIGAKPPVTYLKERIDWTSLGESDLKQRLATHLIPNEPLLALERAESEGDAIATSYERFLEERAVLVAKAVDVVWRGSPLDLSLMAGSSVASTTS